MKTIYYKKVGRKYVEVGEYDQDFFDSMPYGTHLVHIEKGTTSRKFNVDPQFVPYLAVLYSCREAMSDALHEANKLRPQKEPITERQQEAWAKFSKEMGESISTLYGPSVYDVLDKFAASIYDKVKGIEDYPAVKAAYDNYLTVAKLCLDK